MCIIRLDITARNNEVKINEIIFYMKSKIIFCSKIQAVSKFLKKIIHNSFLLFSYNSLLKVFVFFIVVHVFDLIDYFYYSL